MGNRAVITTEANFVQNGVGIYIHWNGGRDSVEAFLKYCEMKGYRAPDEDCYGWARLCQVISNFFGGTESIGIDTIDYLDCDNGDNGVYIIRGWEIVDRKYFDGVEQSEYPLDEMLKAIDKNMPETEQFGERFLSAPVVLPGEMHLGDTILYIDYSGEIVESVVEGFGANGERVNGHDVSGIPFTARFSSESCPARKNINNYFWGGKEYRRVK